MNVKSLLDVSAEVAEALASNRPVVALESTIITHGMPYPTNLETALMLEAAVRSQGATPATIAVIDGRFKVGLSADELERLARLSGGVVKASRRDLAAVAARHGAAGTTVAATMYIAELAGIEIFATGGIGGVHRGAEETFDISADLVELARTKVAVVCAGAKSILDIDKTLEYLESHGVAVCGFRCDEFPAFYARSSGFKLDHRCDGLHDLARMVRLQREIGPGGLLIANPIPEDKALDPAAIEARIAEAVAEAKAKGIAKKEVTPFLLAPRRRADRRSQPRSQHGAGREQRDRRGAGRGRTDAPVSPGRPAAAAPRILVVGDLMIDTIVKPEGPLVRGSDRRAAIVDRPGGSAANQAAWLAHFGAAVDFVARVGAADRRREAARLKRAGVTPRLAGDPRRETGRLIAMVDPSGERSFLTDRGANLALSRARHSRSADRRRGDDPPLRLQLLRPGAARRRHGADRTRRRPAGRRRSRLGRVPARGRRGELPRLDARRDDAVPQRRRSGRARREPTIRAVQGRAARRALSRWSSSSAAPRVARPSQERNAGAPPAPPAEAKDSTGAGDAFVAAFLVARLAGRPIEHCLAEPPPRPAPRPPNSSAASRRLRRADG